MEPRTQKINNASYTLKEAKNELRKEIEDQWKVFVEECNEDPKEFIKTLGYQFQIDIPDELEIKVVKDSSKKIYINVVPKDTHPEFY